MMGLIAAGVGAATSAIGSRNANKAAAANADKQMDFQERMSSTAHQREVKDLKEAGLNPMLSAKLGGASTPTGAAAPVENVGASAAAGASSAAQVYNQATIAKATVDNIRAQTQLSSAQAAKTMAETPREGQVQNKIDAEITQLQTSARMGEHTINQIDSQVTKIEAEVKNLYAQNEQIQAQTGLTTAQHEMVKTEIGQMPARLKKLLTEIQQGQANVVNTNMDTYQKQVSSELITKKVIGQMTENEILGIKKDIESVNLQSGQASLPKKQYEAEYHKSGIGQVLNSVNNVVHSISPFGSR